MAGTHRILYVQYTNPAGYPPLEHSSRILAERGWQVLFLGVHVLGVEGLAFPPADSVTIRLLPRVPGRLWLKLHYLAFVLWCLAQAFWFRPQWIYASDPWSCPVGWILKRLLGARLLYHEHDSPNGAFATQSFHHKVACEADAIVLPQAERAEIFVRERAPKISPSVVLNCPRLSEIPGRIGIPDSLPLRLLFQGSLVPSRLPVALIEALVGLPVELWLLGYAPSGAEGHSQRLRDEAQRLGIENQLQFLGPRSRHEMLKITATAHVGLALMPLTTPDLNLRHMVGASNKVFDHFAFGAPVLVTELADWRRWFVEPQYGLSCNPENSASIAKALRWFVENPKERAEMGRRGYERCLKDWNYECQFAPVLTRLEGSLEERKTWQSTAKSS